VGIYRYIEDIMSIEMGKTTILVETETRDKLRHIGRKSDTYDDIIKMLISVYEKEGKNKK
jgi:hypothetical protein